MRFFTKLKTDTYANLELRSRTAVTHGGGGGNRGRGAKASHPPVESQALLLESGFPSEQPVPVIGSKMLKFFTTRDDENESLLGSITEGEN